jgi:DNA-directed RNA polymerase specialized sigma24 family protein
MFLNKVDTTQTFNKNMVKRKREQEEEHEDDDKDQLEDQEEPSSDEEQGENDEFAKKVSKEQLEIMEQKIAANPYQYETHLEFIQALRKNADINALHKAREHFSQYFPISQDQWLLWLQDEESIASTDEEIAKVKSLYERAFQDYQLPKVWEQYCEFMLKHFTSDRKEIESVFERAVTTAGAHMIDGSVLWSLYRNYELKFNEHDKVRELFRQQLAIPSLVLTNIWEEYEKFETNSAEAEKTAPIFQESGKKLEQRLGIEEQLIEAIANKTESEEIWKTYLDLVIEQDPKDLVVQLFERAVQEQCLSERLWNRYIRYLQDNNTPAQDMLTVYNNASRNCSWSSALWCGFLEYMELCQCDAQWIESSFQRALSSMQAVASDYAAVFVAHCSYIMRSKKDDKEAIRSAFVSAFEYITQYFREGDRQCSLERLWAYVEAHRFKDVERARDIYKNIMARFPSEPALWFNYIQFERDNGATNDQIRNIYRQAVNGLENARSKKSMAVAWSQFERERSDSVERVMEAELNVRHVAELVEAENLAAAKAKRGILVVKAKESKTRDRKTKKGMKKEKKVKEAREQEGDTFMAEQQETKPAIGPALPPAEEETEKKPKKKGKKQKQERKPKKNLQEKPQRRQPKEQPKEAQESIQTQQQPDVKPPPAKKRALMKPRALVPSGQPLSNADFKLLFEKK